VVGLRHFPSNSHQKHAFLHIGGAGDSLPGSVTFFAMIIQKTFDARQEVETPTTSDLEAIRKYALREVTADDVFLGKMALANTKVDRSHERIPFDYLKRFCDTLPGKPVMTGHDLNRLPVGRFYEADLVPRPDGEHEIIARFYLPADSPLRKSVELGIASGVSIQGRAHHRTCSVCTKQYERCDHDAGRSYNGKVCIAEWGGDLERYEAIEGSLVANPCQFDAQVLARSTPSGYIAKSAVAGGTIILDYGAEGPAPQEIDMELKEALEKIASLETELGDLKKAQAENEPLVAAGKEYLDVLKEEALTKSGAVSEADKAQTEALLGSFTEPNIAIVKTIHKAAKARFDEKYPPTPLGDVRKGDDQQQPVARPFDPVTATPFQRS